MSETEGFVRVVVETRINGKRRTPKGTGYLVRPDLVLTAGHLLKGSVKSCRVVLDQKTSRQATEVWRRYETDGCDAALLRLDEAVDETPVRTRLARSPLHRDERYWSYGYPKATTSDLSLASLRGKAIVGQPTSPRFEVYVEAEWNAAEGWKGASGAPVLIGKTIHGVIGQAPSRAEGRRLHATWIHPLFEDPDFRQYFEDIEAWEERREELIEELEDILRGQSLAIDALIEAASADRQGRKAPGWRPIKESVNPARLLAETISDTEIGPVLVICNRAYHELWKAAEEATEETERSYHKAREAVIRLVTKVAPFLAAFRLGLQFPESHGGLFQLPSREPTVFEMLLAVVEGREPQWRALSRSGEHPKGLGLIKPPSYEAGTGQEFWAFAKVLANVVFVADDLPRAFRKSVSPEGDELQYAMNRLNQRLEWNAKRLDDPFRYYLILDKVADWNADQLERDLGQYLPAIWLLRSDGPGDDEEYDWCLILSEILFADQEASKRPSAGRKTP